ncbi:MAG: ubiquinol-cytochrome c reductase iron-sulfur subunit [Gammaproteobacteria bacterium]|nr:ubiquinol-cytochrome c reductase iron-sulfur subunit [Gammaproteobacteria bacterium]MBU1447486.1 ubiquinol-cytochrome c reductase iron-sulfur subunit [Gammaproteobacteria bacterium]
MTDNVDHSKRRMLIAATTAVGGVAAAGAGAPFVLSLQPSERAKAAGAPVEVDISGIEPGTMISVEWQGKPVWIVRRTKEMLDLLPKHDEDLADPSSSIPQQPEYCNNATRSIKPEILVVLGVCTHLGCSPTFRPEVAPADLGAQWAGGWFCPCHGSRFDLAARVFKGVPAPTNLIIPPHMYLSETRLLIGDDDKSKLKGGQPADRGAAA